MPDTSFWVPALPRRITSSNGGKTSQHSKRNPHSVAAGKMLLTNEVEEAIRRTYSVNIPILTGLVDVFVTGRIKLHARPKIEDCPRCIQLAVGGEVWWAHDEAPTCGCYRPTDSQNLGGQVTKPVTDSMKRLGMLADDDYRYVRWFATSIEVVDSLEAEGLMVFTREAG